MNQCPDACDDSASGMSRTSPARAARPWHEAPRTVKRGGDALGVLFIGLLSLAWPLPDTAPSDYAPVSLRITDRAGHLLRTMRPCTISNWDKKGGCSLGNTSRVQPRAYYCLSLLSSQIY